MLAMRGEGNVEFHAQAIVETIEFYGKDDGFLVGRRVGGEVQSWQVDRIIANVGYGPDPTLYRELQVHECYASLGPMSLAAALLDHAGGDCLTVPSKGPAVLRTPSRTSTSSAPGATADVPTS